MDAFDHVFTWCHELYLSPVPGSIEEMRDNALEIEDAFDEESKQHMNDIFRYRFGEDLW